MRSQGLWDDDDGFFYDVYHGPDGQTVPIKVRSLVGVLPLLATVVLRPDALGPAGALRQRFARFFERLDAEGVARTRAATLDARRRPAGRSV